MLHAIPRRAAMSLIAALGVFCARAKTADAAAPARPEPSSEGDDRVGQYGAPGNVVTLYEAEGALFIDAATARAQPVLATAAGDLVTAWGGAPATLRFETSQGRVVALTLKGQRLARRDFGAEVVAAIQGGLSASPGVLRAAALAAVPPTESAPPRASDLVDLASIDPRIRFDIRYATADNFMGFPLYEQAAAYLQRPAAQALGRVQEALAAQGYGLMVHDGYRPWFVTKMFWDATPPESRIFVADPQQGSRHNRGCAVDLTLYDLASGEPVEMTGRFDEMSTRSYADFVGGTTRQRARRAILRAAMEAQGFLVLPAEWWHFDYGDWAQYGIGTVSFAQLAAGAEGSR